MWKLLLGMRFQARQCMWGASGECFGEAKCPGCCFLSLSLLYCCAIRATWCCSQRSPTTGPLFSLFPAWQLWLFSHPSHYRPLLWLPLQQLLVSHTHTDIPHRTPLFHGSSGQIWRTGSEGEEVRELRGCRHTSGQAQLEAGRSRGTEKR